MKTRPRNLLLAAALLGMGAQHSASGSTMTFTRRPELEFIPSFRIKKELVTKPTRNQRKIRKARRQRHAAGVRNSFT